MLKLLLSGGLDSFISGFYVKSQNLVDSQNITAIFINWGQPTINQERISAKYCADFLGLSFEEIQIQISSKQMRIGSQRPGPRVVPGRNKAFINAVLCDNTRAVVIGCIKDDYNDYLDCRREYFDDLEKELDVKIITPLIYKTKREIVKTNKGLPLHLTWSCYESNISHPCGECSSCNSRNFAMLNT